MVKNLVDRLEGGLPWLILLLMHLELRATSILSLCSVLLLLISFIKLGRETKGIALLLFIAPILVLLFRLGGLSITAYPITILFGLYLLKQYFRIIINSHYIILSYLGLVVTCILWFIYGPQHTYAQTKLITILSIGTGAIFACLSLMKISSDEAQKLAKLLVAISLLYMSVALEFFGFPYPSSLLDFDLFRVGFYDYIRTNEDLPFTYHSMGIPILFACALLLGAQEFLRGKKKLGDLLLISLCLYLVLLSQARQAIFGIFIILALRVWVSRKFSSSGKIALVFLVIGALFFIFTGIETTAFTQAASDGTFAINRNYDRALKLIDEYPILGTGLGGYSVTGLRDYPHNILWELLSEFGLLGTFLVGLFSARQIIIHPKRALYYVNQYGQILLLIVAAFGVRALSSSDLTENIVWLVALIVYSDAIRREGVLKDKLLFSRDRYVK